ncbi:hypothetical protein, partial [Enterococcus faecalis]|uniref:hypothetical protein n=1 Tax=Enterococcus faecalis TaxID=1351 RepID=UPI003CC57799
CFQGSIFTFVSKEFKTNSPSGFILETTIKIRISKKKSRLKTYKKWISFKNTFDSAYKTMWIAIVIFAPKAVAFLE